ncbi:MAG: hypothetical protein AAF244_03125 [Pseudomonadota bacterium]
MTKTTRTDWLTSVTEDGAEQTFAAQNRAAARELHGKTKSFEERLGRIKGVIVDLSVAFKAPAQEPKPARKPHFELGELDSITADLRAALRPEEPQRTGLLGIINRFTKG